MAKALPLEADSVAGKHRIDIESDRSHAQIYAYESALLLIEAVEYEALAAGPFSKAHESAAQATALKNEATKIIDNVVRSGGSLSKVQEYLDAPIMDSAPTDGSRKLEKLSRDNPYWNDVLKINMLLRASKQVLRSGVI